MQQITYALEIKKYKLAKMIFKKHEPNNIIYIIIKGQVAIVKDIYDNQEIRNITQDNNSK